MISPYILFFVTILPVVIKNYLQSSILILPLKTSTKSVLIQIMSFLILTLFTFNIILAAQAQVIFRNIDDPLRHVRPSEYAKTPIWHNITQKVDHFNPTDNRIWSMRYISNDQFFDDSGPIFVLIGAEWEIAPQNLMGGHMFEIAQQNKGMMFYTEHRYYGRSFPFKHLAVENLKYLSADQALVDLVYFIQKIKETNSSLANSKVVVVGGSYGGTLATWARLKYPHIVDIAYASSAPLHALADFYEYMEVVGDQIRLQSQECANTIFEGISELERKLETTEGIREMSERFRMCETIRTDEPYRSYFFLYVNYKFPGIVQYGTYEDIQYMCTQLMSYPGKSLDKLISWVNFGRFPQSSTPAAVLDETLRDHSGNILDKFISYQQSSNHNITNCVLGYDQMIEIGRNDENNSTGRMWCYQTCSEFGWYQTTSSKKQPFGNNFGLQLFNKICTDTFGEAFNEQMLDNGIYRTNLLYGSTKLSITKLITVHGTMDPWHPMGMLETPNPLAPVIIINGTSHCADLGALTNTSPIELQIARDRVQKLICDWLK